MAKLPASAITPPTVRKIYEAYEKKRGDWRRAHLGASQIGKECDRALWYQFRWAWAPSFPGRVLRLFDTGHREEARLVADLRAIGVKVHEVDPETGEQFTVLEHGGHFGGSLDGAGQGFEESGAWHLLEFKTSNAKNFRRLQKEGVEKAQPTHYAQMQTYMHLTGMQRAYYLAVCKDTDEIHGERVRYHAPTALRLLERARRIITAAEPPPKLSEDPDHWQCRWCDYAPICHGGKVTEVSCRTCAHATPELDGERRWSCATWKEDLSVGQQKAGCSEHRFIPALVPLRSVDASAEDNWIEYEGGVVNGGAGMDSETMREVLNAGDG